VINTFLRVKHIDAVGTSYFAGEMLCVSVPIRRR
jgi:hypothetical protein